MPSSLDIGVEWAWVIPALSASAFVIAVLFGRFLPKAGAFVSITAIFLGFVLFWFVLADLLSSGPANISIDWLEAGIPVLRGGSGWTVSPSRCWGS